MSTSEAMSYNQLFWINTFISLFSRNICTFVLRTFLLFPCILFNYTLNSFTHCAFHPRGTLNDIVPFSVLVPQSSETRGTSLYCILLKEPFASKSNLSNAFSNSSRSDFDIEHFNARDVAFRDSLGSMCFQIIIVTCFFSI
jgi:hypothetical protein